MSTKAIFERKDIDNIPNISKLRDFLEKYLDSVQEQYKKKVRDFLGFLDDETQESITILCTDIENILQSYSKRYKPRQHLSNARNSFTGERIKTTSKKDLYYCLSEKENGERIKFQNIVGYLQSAETLSTYHFRRALRIAQKDEKCGDVSTLLLELAEKHNLTADDGDMRIIEEIEERA